MKIFFWICWISDVIIMAFFSFSLLTSYLSGVMDNKSADDIIEFLLLFAGVMALVITAFVLYNKRWHKTATLLAAIPFLSLLFIFLIPIVAYLSGERMN